jgi:hypothetical protein
MEVKQTTEATAMKTCFNCRWLTSESEIGTFCQKNLDHPVNDDLSPGKAAITIAANCQSYEFADDDPTDLDPNRYDIYSDVLRLQGMGLLDKNGMPTDAFFECLV